VPTLLKRMGMYALFVAVGWPAAAVERDAVTARVRPSVGFAPSDVVIQAFIEPNALNRSVTFVADSGTYYASSMANLDGDQAPRVTEVRFRTLPEGWYEVRVTLFGTEGERGRFVGTVELR
jgi:hypothetical protein